jgi:hypothetical protein
MDVILSYELFDEYQIHANWTRYSVYVGDSNYVHTFFIFLWVRNRVFTQSYEKQTVRHFEYVPTFRIPLWSWSCNIISYTHFNDVCSKRICSSYKSLSNYYNIERIFLFLHKNTSENFQLNQPTRCNNFLSLLLVV